MILVEVGTHPPLHHLIGVVDEVTMWVEEEGVVEEAPAAASAVEEAIDEIFN